MTRVIAGETLIIPVRNRVGDLSAIYTLNEVGARVWQMIEGGARVSQMVEALSHEYDVMADQAARDVVELLDSMEAAGLVRRLTESEA